MLRIIVFTGAMIVAAAAATAVSAGDRLYVTNQNGTTIVFRPNPEKFELLAENKLNEGSNSTIAVSDGQIFLRTFQNLFCIAEK